MSFNFTFDTESVVDAPVNDNAEYDAYFMIATKNGEAIYKAHAKPEFRKDLTVMIASLGEEIMTDDILVCLPGIIENGEEIVEDLIDILSYKEENYVNFEEELEKTAICQPALIFNKERNSEDE